MANSVEGQVREVDKMVKVRLSDWTLEGPREAAFPNRPRSPAGNQRLRDESSTHGQLRGGPSPGGGQDGQGTSLRLDIGGTAGGGVSKQAPVPRPGTNAFATSPRLMANSVEGQVREVDKMVKECDQARKQLDQLVRRLDDLYDEVKRYKDFLTYEKARRDPGAYKGANTHTHLNGQVSSTMNALTSLLCQEWEEKLKGIRGNLQPPANPSPTPSSSLGP